MRMSRKVKNSLHEAIFLIDEFSEDYEKVIYHKNDATIVCDFFDGWRNIHLTYFVSETEVKKELDFTCGWLTHYDFDVIEFYLLKHQQQKSIAKCKFLNAINKFKNSPRGKLFWMLGADEGKINL